MNASHVLLGLNQHQDVTLFFILALWEFFKDSKVC